MYSNQSAPPNFIGVSVTGNLISSEKIDQISNSRLDRNTSKSYFDQEDINIREEISVAFRLGQVLWENYSSIEHPNFTESIDFARQLLHKLFGFDQIDVPNAPKTIDSHTYNIAMEANNKCVPIVVAPSSQKKNKDSFDVAYREFGDRTGSRTKRRPDILLQEYLNAIDDTLWGIAIAGESIRLMRKNASFTRPTFIEFNLNIIFENHAFSDFTAMWLMLHSSRLSDTKDSPSDCWLEKWRVESIKAGTVIRDRLRGNFEKALLAFGNGFLRSNPRIVNRLDNNSLRLEEFLEQLIRLVYRLIFLAVAEERDFIHSRSTKSSVRRLYYENYGFEQLRRRAIKRSMRNDSLDVWEGVRILLRAFDNGEKKLGIPALGGLFDQKTTRDLNDATISNDFLMEGIYYLSFVDDRNTRTRINWRDMATEELGSVYEGLLELIPSRMAEGRSFNFLNPKMGYGSKRRSAGAYYTPDALVQALLDRCLEPVLDSAERSGGLKEILNLKIIDPACGSGHFLLGAARRIADRVCKLRDAEQLDYQQALRDVIRQCIFGVDNDRLTVELAKVSLWIEAVEPGKPLGYLDENIKCGNSTLGIFKLDTLVRGIPDEAYESDLNENQLILKKLKQRNRSERAGQGILDFKKGEGWMPEPPNFDKNLSQIRNLPENTEDQKDTKEEAFKNLKKDIEFIKWKNASDLYISSFFISKEKYIKDSLPTTGDVWRAFGGEKTNPDRIAVATQYSIEMNAFHWFLEFFDILTQGGFDVVIGNPPWEEMAVIEREFFHSFPNIENETNSEKRKKLIRDLFKDNPDIEISWIRAKNINRAKGDYIRKSNQFPLTSNGKLNLYSLFTEISINLTYSKSWVGLILKSTVFTGATNSKLTKYLISTGKLRCVYDFKNVGFFNDVSSGEQFSLVTIGPENNESNISLGVGLTSTESLSDTDKVILIDRNFPLMVNPETGTLPQCETIADIQSLERVSKSFKTLGKSNWKVNYSGGLNMASKAKVLRDFNSLRQSCYHLQRNHFYNGKNHYLPVYEGKNIHQYDHRFGTFDTVSENIRFRIKASPRNPEEKEKEDRNFEIIPRYWIREENYLSDLGRRKIGSTWNFVFRDVVNVFSNARTAIGCIVGQVCGSLSAKVAVVDGGNATETALFLSMFNSVPYDYLLRQKFYGQHLNKSLLMQSFVVDRDSLVPYKQEVLKRVGRLTGTSVSVQSFIDQLGVNEASEYSTELRLNDRAWLDALYFNLYGFNLELVDYIFSTFSIWERKSVALWGRFREKELTLEYFEKF